MEESLHILDVGGVEVFEVAVEIMRVRIFSEGLLRQIEPVKAAIRLIEDVDAHFFFHHFPLVVEVRGRKIQRLHPVGLEPQHRVKRGDGSRFDIFGEIVARVAVVPAAAAFDHAVEDAFGSLGRALEHHVLEKMREAGSAFRLQPEAASVCNAKSKRWRRVLFGDHYDQPVLQLPHFGLDLPVLSRRTSHEQARGHENQNGSSQSLHGPTSFSASQFDEINFWPPASWIRPRSPSLADARV